MRIVSLLPSATELVYALGLGEDLAGVTYECDHPPDVASKPVVCESALPPEPLSPAAIDATVRDHMRQRTPLYRLNEERIRYLQPDVILTQDLCRVCAVPSRHVQEVLDRLGCSAEVVSMDPHTLEDVTASFLEVGRVLGRESRARDLVESFRSRIAAVREKAALLPAIRTLALEWQDPPWVGGHWIPQMVEIAGGANLLNEPGAPSRTVGWNEVAKAMPEVIVFMPCGSYLEEAEEQAAALFEVPDFAETPAAAAGTVYAVDATSYFSRPGPRLVEGLEILAWAIHPDAFPEPPEGRISRLER